MHTLRTAAHLGVAPNGKAVRAALWDQPHAAASNIYVQAGQADPAELRRSIRRGLVVEGVMRPGRITPSTGKFTIVVQGWWIEQGEAVQRVSDVPLSASIFSLLRGVRQCGADLQFSPLADGAGAPSLLIGSSGPAVGNMPSSCQFYSFTKPCAETGSWLTQPKNGENSFVLF